MLEDVLISQEVNKSLPETHSLGKWKGTIYKLKSEHQLPIVVTKHPHGPLDLILSIKCRASCYYGTHSDSVLKAWVNTARKTCSFVPTLEVVTNDIKDVLICLIIFIFQVIFIFPPKYLCLLLGHLLKVWKLQKLFLHKELLPNCSGPKICNLLAT